MILSANSTNDLNELSSKSLLANVLDINDDFGVINKTSYFNKFSNNRSNPKIPNEQMNGLYSPYQNNQAYLRRENSSLSQSVFDNSNDTYSTKDKNDVLSLRKNLNLILKELRVITNKLKDDEEDEQKSLNWKFAAMVIDRLCMFIFAIATFISTVLILFTSNNFFKSSDPDERFQSVRYFKLKFFFIPFFNSYITFYKHYASFHTFSYLLINLSRC